jgi:hypothetical protein
MGFEFREFSAYLAQGIGVNILDHGAVFDRFKYFLLERHEEIVVFFLLGERVEEVCSSDVGAIRFIADAEGGEDYAAVEVVVVRKGGGAEVIDSTALDDGGVRPFYLFRIELGTSEYQK